MSAPHSSGNRSHRRGASIGLAVRVAAAWGLVGVPLAWGVWQVFQKSLDLFR
jgi:hypothetical protein